MFETPRRTWDELTTLLDRLDRHGLSALSADQLKRMCQLYRQVSIDLSRARTSQADPELVFYLNHLAARAHGRIYAARRVDILPFFAFLTSGFPRLVRRQARPILLAVLVLAVTTMASFLAVVRQPELAYSLFDERIVEFENIRLEKHEGEYRGNFTFTLSESPFMALQIIGNNIKVAAFTFALGSLCCLPGALLLSYNGRMLGTLSGLVWKHGYLVGFYSLIATHGVLELSAICIAGGGGLRLGWALIAPGPLPRRDALKKAAPDAFGLLGGAMVMLVFAGLIEAHITPHVSAPLRWSVAALSAILLACYLGLGGRARAPQEK